MQIENVKQSVHEESSHLRVEEKILLVETGSRPSVKMCLVKSQKPCPGALKYKDEAALAFWFTQRAYVNVWSERWLEG